MKILLRPLMRGLKVVVNGIRSGLLFLLAERASILFINLTLSNCWWMREVGNFRRRSCLLSSLRRVLNVVLSEHMRLRRRARLYGRLFLQCSGWLESYERNVCLSVGLQNRSVCNLLFLISTRTSRNGKDVLDCSWVNLIVG